VVPGPFFSGGVISGPTEVSTTELPKVMASERWRLALEAWAIPEVILAQAEVSPWILPPALFQTPAAISPTPSHDRAREALGLEASVLDVGCGGGVAAFALLPEVQRVTGVDRQREMLAMFEANARDRGLVAETVEGLWPEVASRTRLADVVTAHHVVYNVGDVVPFLRALDEHARFRVVTEMTTRHPLTSLNEAWMHFWGLERPSGPTSDDLVEVLDEMGLRASLERFEGTTWSESSPYEAANFARIRLCLPASRESEVRAFLQRHPAPTARSLVTLWWDHHS
jgi:SAM-dependent methyltransferase